MDRADNATIEFRTYLELIPDPSFASIPDGRIVMANTAAAELLGVELDELIGRSVFEFIPASEQASLKESRAEFFANPEDGGTLGIQAPMHAIRADGTEFPFEATVALAELERGPVRIASVRDISERIKAEKERKRLEDIVARNQAARMESIGQLAGGIAHDFNNLLAVISNCAAFVAESIDDEGEVAEDVQQIIAAADRAASLTRQLLVFSRKSPEDRRPINTNEVVENLERLLKRTLGAQFELETTLEPKLATVVADPSQIEGAILNLTLNARDAMPDGGKLSIATANVEVDESYSGTHPDRPKPGRYVQLSVSDEGSGMDRETIERAFEPFYTTKDRMRGTGLGLATVYGTVTNHGGTVHIDSTPGIGSTVTILLPVSGAAAESEPPNRCEAGSNGKGSRVIVVEDDDAVRRMIIRALERREYDVVDFSRGEPALEFLQNPDERASMLLTDVVMPGLQGDEVADRAVELRPELPVLLMSGYSEIMVGDGPEDRRAARVLQKPFSVDQLLSEVQRTVRK